MTFRLVYWETEDKLFSQEIEKNVENVPLCAICRRNPCFQVVSSLYCSSCTSTICWKKLVQTIFQDKFAPAPTCFKCKEECDEICEISEITNNFSHQEEKALKIRLYTAICAKCQELEYLLEK